MAFKTFGMVKKDLVHDESKVNQEGGEALVLEKFQRASQDLTEGMTITRSSRKEVKIKTIMVGHQS